jgi:membrane-bound metal-dependent hydrolase YbcI (DUF457 family)
MPVTPFHFGPGAALHALMPARVSFRAFCAANVVIDVESLRNLVLQREPVHAFLHTWLGATLVIVAMLLVYALVRGPLRALGYEEFAPRGPFTPGRVAGGIALGAWSHVLLDSLMHADMAPFAPWGTQNALLGMVSLEALHLGCAAAGAFGLLLLGLRWLLFGATWRRRQRDQAFAVRCR